MKGRPPISLSFESAIVGVGCGLPGVVHTAGFNKRLMCGSEKQGEGVTSVLLSTLERKVNDQTGRKATI